MLKEESSAAVSMASHSASDGRAKAPKPDGVFGGKAYFVVDSDTFYKALKGRKKGQHWSNLMGKSDTMKNVRTYAKANGNPSIMLNRANTQEFIVIQ